MSPKRIFDDTKQVIIDAAQQLFMQKGYDNTSMADIIANAGVSKGGLYHYFESKKDIMLSIVETYVASVIDAYQEIIDKKGLTAIGKINAIIGFKEENFSGQTIEFRRMMMGIYMEPEKNLELRYQLQKGIEAFMIGTWERIITQGNSEGLFKVKFPLEMGTLLFLSQNSLGPFMISNIKNPEKLKKIMASYYDFLERVLGAEEGSIFRLSIEEFAD